MIETRSHAAAEQRGEAEEHTTIVSKHNRTGRQARSATRRTDLGDGEAADLGAELLRGSRAAQNVQLRAVAADAALVAQVRNRATHAAEHRATTPDMIRNSSNAP